MVTIKVHLNTVSEIDECIELLYLKSNNIKYMLYTASAFWDLIIAKALILCETYVSYKGLPISDYKSHFSADRFI